MNTKTKSYNREFAKIKPWILLRDNFRCQMTLEVAKIFGYRFYDAYHSGILTIDHIRRRSLNGQNTKENLITLCSSCHSLAESAPTYLKEAELTGLLAKKYGYSYSGKGGDNSKLETISK